MSPRSLLVVLLLAVAGLAGATAVDLDGDGVATERELRDGTDPLVADTDGDGLDDGEELAVGTDPLARDTDGEGLEDGAEVARGTVPTLADTDADRVDDADEVARGTNPTTADSDGDGLDDGEELGRETDPLVADSDGDGLGDGTEVDAGTDPLSRDTDADGLDDPTELTGETDPTRADTDGDGLGDGDERARGTDPLVADSDDDGLDDGPEVDRGADPLAPDTDGDGFRDGAEVHRGDVLPGADPTRFDVFVEVDAVGDETLPRGDAERVEAAFDDAPVGREGARGIRIHLAYNETGLTEAGAVRVADRPNRVGGESVRLEEYLDDHFDYRGYGYHYALVAPAVLDVPEGEVVGEAEPGLMVVQVQRHEGATGSTLMHELGHSLGVDREDFDGIDARRYTVSEYPSVMNYNTPPDFYGFSAGAPFDDWAAIVEEPFVPDRGRLDGGDG